MLITPIWSHLSLAHSQLWHHLNTPRLIIPLYLSILWQWVNTKYSIHWVLHHSKINCLQPPASLIFHLSAYLVLLDSLHSNHYEVPNEYDLSSYDTSCRSTFSWLTGFKSTACRSTVSRLTACRLTTCRITTSILTACRLITCRLAACRLTASSLSATIITTSKYCFNLRRLWPLSASRNSLHYSFQVHPWDELISVSKFISKLTKS